MDKNYFDFNPVARNHVAPAPFMRGLLASLAPQPYVLGVDLSHWNSSVDFKALKAGGYEFVILKATEQTGYTDPTFSSRWRQALDAGMIVGTYHFFRSNYDGGDQANHHLETIYPLLAETKGKVIPPCNDVETADGVSVSVRQTRLRDWDKLIRAEIWSWKGADDSLCYSSQYLWQTLTGNMALDVTGWGAHWTSSLAYLWPYGWPAAKRKFVQFGVFPKHSWAPRVPGVSGEVDVNKFLGTLDELKALVGIRELSDAEKLARLWNAHPELHEHWARKPCLPTGDS